MALKNKRFLSLSIKRLLQNVRNISLIQLYFLKNVRRNFKSSAQSRWCGQVLIVCKKACLQLCSQGGQSLKSIKACLSVFAHTIKVDCEGFYKFLEFVYEGENSSPILTTPTHHKDFVKVVRIGEDRRSKEVKLRSKEVVK